MSVAGDRAPITGCLTHCLAFTVASATTVAKVNYIPYLAVLLLPRHLMRI